ALNNYIAGNYENNELWGSGGYDTMAGGYGDDGYYVDSTYEDVISESADAGTDSVYAYDSYSLDENVENLYLYGGYYAYGNALNNYIAGNYENNELWGSGGYDTMAGGYGDDGYYVDSTYEDVISEGVDAGTDSVYAYSSYSLDENVENLYLYGSAYYGEGNALNNYIVGNSENNYFSAWGGIDTIAGDYGNDAYYIDSTDDVIIEGVDAGTDSVGAYSSYTLDENVENLYMYIGYYGYGNALNNYIAGNSDSNLFWGGGGNDTMAGDYGDDAYYVDSTYEDVISEGVDAGIDSVYAYASYSLDENVENLYMYSGYYGYGNALNNYIAGNSENNDLWGSTGDDTITGGAGSDVLTGGTGADYFTFYSSSEVSDTITDFIWEEGDKFAVSASGFGGGLITTSGTTPGDLHSSQFVIGAAPASSSERIIYNSSTGAVYFDEDGTGATAQIQIATLSPYLNLISSDFQVIA
ncbi:MAG: calcium-binding protein, partial [Microcoleus vaginatus WJT46-NPBG5]|nr:calcium-binding protein [Microcoleus vaginatus WJT46-NPBG5]